MKTIFLIVTEEEIILGICDMHKDEFQKNRNSSSILIIVSALYLALTFEGGILIHAEAMIDTYSKKCFLKMQISLFQKRPPPPSSLQMMRA